MSIGRLIRLAIIGWVVGMIAGMVTALGIKRRIVPTTDEAAEEVELAAIFGPLAFHSTATAFRGGLLEAWYGGGVVDLRDATLAPEGATLRVRAVFAGAQILVPPEWRVVSRVRGMGGLSDVREVKGDAIDAPELVIEGLMIGAGIAVQSEVNEEAAWAGAADWGQGWKDGWGQGERSGASQRKRMGWGWKRDDKVADAADTVDAATEAVTDAAEAASDTASEAAESVSEAVADAASDAGDAVAKAESEMAPAT
jgi:hypothetical protein